LDKASHLQAAGCVQILESHGNYNSAFSRPGNSWNQIWVMESHGEPLSLFCEHPEADID